MIKQINKSLLRLTLLVLVLTSCSSYKSSWDCPKVKGIGCSSLEYADSIAKEQIILNASIVSRKILINQDSFGSSLPGKNQFKEIEVPK